MSTYNLEVRKRDYKRFLQIIWRAVGIERKKNTLPQSEDREGVITLFFYTISHNYMPSDARLGEKKVMWEKALVDSKHAYSEYCDVVMKGAVS
jgi:hypothetical protein